MYAPGSDVAAGARMSEQSCRGASQKRSRAMETPREFVERYRSSREQVMGGIVLSAFQAGS
jgi:hypothetical protein